MSKALGYLGEVSLPYLGDGLAVHGIETGAELLHDEQETILDFLGPVQVLPQKPHVLDLRHARDD